MTPDVTDRLTIPSIGFDSLGTHRLRMVDFKDESPEVDANYVKVPGRTKGPLDLTEALAGYPTYLNGTHTFKFSWVPRDASDPDDVGLWDEVAWSSFKTRLRGLLHGKRLAYRLSFDPDYEYVGRFSVSFADSEFDKPWGYATVTVVREPYKYKGLQTYRFNAAGGVKVSIESGAMPVCPTFEFANETLVSFGGESVKMQPGTYKVPDLWFHEGYNEIYLNSYAGDGTVPMFEYAANTIAHLADKMISELSWGDTVRAALTIGDLADDTISLVGGTSIISTEYAVSTDTEKYAVYVQFLWGDL